MLKLDKEKKIILVGYSGHSFEIIDVLIKQGLDIKGYTELSQKVKNPYHLKYLGNENLTNFKYFENYYSYFIAIGDNLIRSKKSKFLNSRQIKQINIIHQDSSVSENLKLGYGNFIGRNASINSSVEIGNNAIINTSAIVEHGCKIESDVHVAPGAVICGAVKIKKGAFVGANAVIKENLCIGKNAIIGAGSVVLENIPDNTLSYGNPSKNKLF